MKLSGVIICPWDDGTALATSGLKPATWLEWGGALQIAAMARIRGVAILVHTDFGLQVFGQGPSWQIRHTFQPGPLRRHRTGPSTPKAKKATAQATPRLEARQRASAPTPIRDGRGRTPERFQESKAG